MNTITEILNPQHNGWVLITDENGQTLIWVED